LAGPFVTSVGGTTSNPEVAAPLSRGGFSLIFPRESYQEAAVIPFLKQLGTDYSGLYKCVASWNQAVDK
jgi:tripeptidyl-peptidase I